MGFCTIWSSYVLLKGDRDMVGERWIGRESNKVTKKKKVEKAEKKGNV